MATKFTSVRSAKLHWFECDMIAAGFTKGSAYREIEKPFNLLKERRKVLNYLKRVDIAEYCAFTKDRGFEPDSNNRRCYFIQSGEFVKIGYSDKCIKKRLSSLQISSPFELILLAVIDSRQYTEKQLHSMFSKYHVRGEWFQLSDEIKTFINTNGVKE